MDFRHGCALWVCVFLTAVLGGCIPSEPPAETVPEPVSVPEPVPVPVQAEVSPPVAAEPAEAIQEPKPESVPAPSATGPANALSVNMEPGAVLNAAVQVKPLENGTGFGIQGSFGEQRFLTGTISPVGPDPKQWTVAGEFTFPRRGYGVAGIYASSLSDFSVSGGTEQLGKTTEMVIVTIPVKFPRSGKPVANQVTKVPFSKKIDAGKNTQFMVVLSVAPNQAPRGRK